MLRGDLKTTPLPDLLKRLSEAKATGCVYVQPAGRRSEEATVALRDGAICNVTMPGAEDGIGARLVASGRLTPADLAEAREAQETELATWTLAELLIHLGLAEQQTVEDLVLEQTLAALTELCEWPAGNWRFRRRERTGPSLPSPLDVTAALATVADRQAEWLALREKLHSADAVVSLAAHPESPDEDPNLEMDADSFALLCGVDGAKTISELAGASGFTLLAAGHKIAALVDSGLVQVAHPSHEEFDDESAEDPAGADPADAGSAGAGGLAAIAAAFAVDVDNDFPLTPIGAPWQAPRTSNGDTLADALARVSAALSEAMTDATGEPEPYDEFGATYEAPAPAAPEPDVAPEADVADEAEVEAEEVVEVEAAVEVEVPPENEVEAAAPDEVEVEEYLAAVITLPVAAYEPAPGTDEAEQNDETEETDETDEPLAEEPAADEATLEPEAEEPVPDEAADAEPGPEALAGADEDLEPEGLLAEAEETPAADPAAETTTEPEAELLETFAALVEPDQPVEDVAEMLAETPAVEEAAEAEAAQAPAQEPAPTTHDSRASAANAARLLSQFSEEEPLTAPEPEPEAPPAAPEGHAPRPRRENGLADTAALLRELSSLGTETSANAPRIPVSRPPAQPPANGGQHARKRKGLFGRG